MTLRASFTCMTLQECFVHYKNSILAALEKCPVPAILQTVPS